MIEDTGIGIRPDESDRIFARFYKVDKFSKGSGLGLAIANEIMEMCIRDRLMPQWKPGMQQGKAVKGEFTLPVTFKLE